MKEISLNGASGAWTLEFSQDGAEKSVPAAVPGCNYHDLMRGGVIDDPFVGENERKSLWVGETNFTYSRKFSLTAEDLQADRILLSCRELDTLCGVYVNDTLVGGGQNCHIAHEFDVTDAVREGENALRVEFFSPMNYVRDMAKRFRTAPDMNFRGRTHIRKPQCHFGWDWGPCIPVSGITGDISLKLYNKARLLPVKITQTHENGKVTLRAQADMLLIGADTPFGRMTPYERKISASQNSDDSAHVRVTLLSPDGEVMAQQDGGEFETVIENPRLWWTHDLSGAPEQPLYTVRAEVFDGSECVDSAEYKIGLRTITLNREADKYGHNFQFILNGVPLFARGANYIPPDSFPDRATTEVKRALIMESVRANMNMLRVWGGGYYETDEFYDICDRAGLLVWQDFAFACAPYPFDREDFLQNVKDEVTCNVTRLRHHASLAVWCGNNELEAMAILWASYRKLSNGTKTFFWGILPKWVKELDSVTPFTATSPTGEAYLKGVAGDKEGDTHLWHVWHGMQPLNFYRKRMTRFCSEFGLESLPSMEAVRSFAEPKDYDMNGAVFNAHQKCMSGNRKILYYLLSRYRLPKDFPALVYLSQLTQAECVRDATEHWRRNKGRCNGSLYWQLNDCWPVCSWAGLDYAGRKKALHYAARRFNEPVAVSVEDSRREVKIYVLNDTLEPRSLTLSLQMMDFSGEILLDEQFLDEQINVDAPPLTARCAHVLENQANRGRVLRVMLLDGSEVISERTLLFGAEKDLALPECKFTAEVEVQDGVAHITACSDKFARSVLVESDLTRGDFSDNFVDFFPGEPRGFKVNANGKTANEIKRSLRFTTVGNITNTYSKTQCGLKRAKIMARPTHFGAWVVFRLGLA